MTSHEPSDLSKSQQDETWEDPEPPTDAERIAVERERERLAGFVKQLSGDDIKSGNWFVKLLTFSLGKYHEQANWEFFQRKYAGVPADAIVAQRIKLASRYAAIEGSLSASAYTVAVAATIGSLGGASPLTAPAAVTTVLADIVYISQLQIRLAYDISVLYRVPIDVNDPEDLIKLVKIALTIKSGEMLNKGFIRAIPVVLRPLIRKYYAGAVLATARGLPFVGKFLLQRTVIKIAIPGVGIPLATALNYWTTRTSGRHSQAVFRDYARIIECADRIVSKSSQTQLMLWVAWLVIASDRKHSESESFLMRQLIQQSHTQKGIQDSELSKLVEIDESTVWSKIDEIDDDLDDVVNAAQLVAEIDGSTNKHEERVLAELRRRCDQSKARMNQGL